MVLDMYSSGCMVSMGVNAGLGCRFGVAKADAEITRPANRTREGFVFMILILAVCDVKPEFNNLAL
jgi:hypothetical protein